MLVYKYCTHATYKITSIALVTNVSENNKRAPLVPGDDTRFSHLQHVCKQSQRKKFMIQKLCSFPAADFSQGTQTSRASSSIYLCLCELHASPQFLGICQADAPSFCHTHNFPSTLEAVLEIWAIPASVSFRLKTTPNAAQEIPKGTHFLPSFAKSHPSSSKVRLLLIRSSSLTQVH